MNTNLNPATALEVLGIIAGLEWRALTDNDYAAFAGASDDARIAEASSTASIRLSNLFGFDLHADTTIMAVLGGEDCGNQMELHGMTPDGDTICIAMPVTFDNLMG